MANLFPTIPDVMASNHWVGRPLSDAIKAYGKPTDTVRSENNEPVARWTYYRRWTETRGSNAISAGPSPGGVTITPTSYDVQQERICRLELTYNEQGIITHLNTWKNVVGGCAYWSFTE